MKDQLNWQSKAVANIYDETPLWSAPFGRLLLENIPMKAQSKVLDIGFGTGFPLIELSQRLGAAATIYGIDLWEQAINRAREKIRVLEISNITIFEQSATTIPLPDQTLDLVCSNLGVNNFTEKEKVLQEVFRVLKPGGSLCITTNPIGTFDHLFQVFIDVLGELQLPEQQAQFRTYVAHRGTQEQVVNEIESIGFEVKKIVSDDTCVRFVDAAAIFDHGLIRIGFRASWEEIVPAHLRDSFFSLAKAAINLKIKEEGEFRLAIPMLYLEFVKAK